jgi:peptidoglycan/LPS O-acetylase OafA/YrhL
MTTKEHFHALDNLRAVMMWLGIVLHAGVAHVVRPLPNITWHDTATTLGADTLVLGIHAFRMPVFFILAGFFVALLCQRYGPRGMLRHRLRRIGLPFAVFWPVLFAAMTVSLAVYHGLMTTGRPWSDPWALPTPAAGDRIGTYHLWFLYLLLGYCLVVAAAALGVERIPAHWRRSGARLGLRIATRWWGLPVLMIPLIVAGLPYERGVVVVYFSFFPHASVWLYHGAFFAFGLFVYHHRHELLARYQRHWRGLGAAGLASFLTALTLFDLAERAEGHPGHLYTLAAVGYAASSWLGSFALIGLFQRVLGQPRPWLQYVADSSFWVYLVHLPVVVLTGAVLYARDWSPWLKMGLNVMVTTAVCLVTYQLLVRHTAIGVLLNGRRGGRYPAGAASAHATVGENRVSAQR